MWLAMAWAGGALIGAVGGSYAVTAGLRLSRGESASSGRSRCDGCGETLGLASTVPVLSYLLLRGACAHCRVRIDPVHLGGEVAGAAVGVSAVSLAAASPLRAGLFAAIGGTLIAACAVDFKIHRLPDGLVGAVALMALALSIASGPAAVLTGLVAASIVTATLLGLREIGRLTRAEPGLGLGDVKLMASLALWLGAATPPMVLLACGLGLAAAPWLQGPDRRLPFGPMIAMAACGIGLAHEQGWAPWAL